MKVTPSKDARTLGDLVRAADTLSLELHVRLRPKCEHSWRIVRCQDGSPDEEEKCDCCQATRPGDPLNLPRWECGLPMQVGV